MEGGEFPHQFAGTLVMGVRSLENYFQLTDRHAYWCER